MPVGELLSDFPKSMNILNKIIALNRPFPYLPEGMNQSLKPLFLQSLKNAKFKYKILFHSSRFIYKVLKQLNITPRSKNLSIFQFEINLLKKHESDFLYQNQSYHLFDTGRKEHNEIVNNKVLFHDFCEKNNIPTAQNFGEVRHGKLLIRQPMPWDSGRDFFIKPIYGSKSQGIVEFRFIGNETYLVLNDKRELKADVMESYLKVFFRKRDFIIQERLEPPRNFTNNGLKNVPIIRILSHANGSEIEVLNPVLVLNANENYLNPYLSNKNFYALDKATGKIIDKIRFNGKEGSEGLPSNWDNFLHKWPDLPEKITRAHYLLNSIKWLGWDIAYCKKNEFIFLESNTSPWIELHQKLPFDQWAFQQKFLSL